MIYKPTNSNGFSHATHINNTDQFINYDGSITQRLSFQSFIEKGEDGVSKLKTHFKIIVLYQGNEIFDYTSTIPYYIPVPVSVKDEDLKEVIAHTYNLTKNGFNERRREFRALPELKEIDPQDMLKSLLALRLTLSPIVEQHNQ
jgi:hypothetical protein